MSRRAVTPTTTTVVVTADVTPPLPRASDELRKKQELAKFASRDIAAVLRATAGEADALYAMEVEVDADDAQASDEEWSLTHEFLKSKHVVEVAEAKQARFSKHSDMQALAALQADIAQRERDRTQQLAKDIPTFQYRRKRKHAKQMADMARQEAALQSALKKVAPFVAGQ